MANPSSGYTITLRVRTPATQRATSELVHEVAAAGASVTGVDVAHSHQDHLVVDVTCDTADGAHSERIVEAVNALRGMQVLKVPTPRSCCTWAARSRCGPRRRWSPVGICRVPTPPGWHGSPARSRRIPTMPGG